MGTKIAEHKSAASVPQLKNLDGAKIEKTSRNFLKKRIFFIDLLV